MRRRDFLRLGGLALGGGALASCSSSPSAQPSPTSLPARSSSTSTTTLAPATASDWSSLSRSLSGQLVRPGDPDYLSDAQSYNPVFDGARPVAIAYVDSPADTALAVDFARRHGITPSIRSGGHSYGGWSTGDGLVIDVSHLDSVEVTGGLVTVGAGTRLIDLYAACAAHGVAVPGGSCPTVGIAGLTLGGGLGVIDRKFGLTCDNLVRAEVVLASGERAVCDATHDSDLFWALRGGGGGSFGVVTSLTFGSHPIGELAIFTLVWEWPAAAEVVHTWQRWAPFAPDELWSNCLLLASQQTPLGVAATARVTGVYVGSQADLESELEPFLAAIKTAPFTDYVGKASYLDTMLLEAGCDGDTVAQCHLVGEDPAGILTREPFAARSDIATRFLPDAGVTTLLAAVERRQSSSLLSGGGVALDASGGAINRVAPGATAYVHRDAVFTMQYSANWTIDTSSVVVAANRSWLAEAWRSMRPYVSGQAYQNYADPHLANWQTAYYGANLSRLEQVKAAYDPADLFHFPQSVPLPPGARASRSR